MIIGRLVVVLTVFTVGLQAFNVYRRHGPVPLANLLARAPTPVPTLRLDRFSVKGQSVAKIVVVEFTDYECPYCARHAITVRPALELEFVSTGVIRYASANNPLTSHARARFLAAATLCAGRQNRYWEMHDALFRGQSRTDDQVVSLATRVGADTATFEKCLKDDPGVMKAVDADAATARELGLSSTPSFVVGRVIEDGKLAIDSVINGAQPIEAFRKAIDDAVARARER